MHSICTNFCAAFVIFKFSLNSSAGTFPNLPAGQPTAPVGSQPFVQPQGPQGQLNSLVAGIIQQMASNSLVLRQFS